MRCLQAFAFLVLFLAACEKADPFEPSLAEPGIDDGTWKVDYLTFHKTEARWRVQDSLQCFTVLQDSTAALWLYFRRKPDTTGRNRAYLIVDKPANDSEVWILAHLGDCCGFASSQRKDVNRYLRVSNQNGRLRFTTSEIDLHKSSLFSDGYDVPCSINLTD